MSKRDATPTSPWWEADEYRNGGDPLAAFVHLTPAMAAELMTVNDSNRFLTDSHVDALAGAIMRDEWMKSVSAAMSITRDGILSDGQHRCAAVIKAGKAIDVLIIFNADPAAQAVTDQGRRRTFADVLHIRGEHDAKTLAAATRALYWWEVDGVPVAQNRPIAATVPQLDAVLERRSGLRNSIESVANMAPLATRAFAVAHHYVFGMANLAAADEFFELVRSGEMLSKGNPIYVLREWLIGQAKQTDRSGISLTRRSAYFHQTWHAWRQGASLRRLDSSGGAFPKIQLDDEFPDL